MPRLRVYLGFILFSCESFIHSLRGRTVDQAQPRIDQLRKERLLHKSSSNSTQFEVLLMPDLVALATFFLLFLLAVLYVHGCDRLKGAR